MGQKGGPGGGAQLALDRPAVGGDPGEKGGGGGRGDGHDAVGAADGTAAHVDGGDHDALGPEQVEGIAHARHIGHGVQRAHLVVVDVAHRAAVGLGLGPGDGVIDPAGVVLHLLGEGQMVDEMGNGAGGGVVVIVAVVMVMVMAVLVVVVMAVVVVMVMVMLMLMLMVVVMLVLMVMVVVMMMLMTVLVVVVMMMLMVMTVLVLMVVVMVMVMIVTIGPLLDTVDGHMHVSARDARGDAPLGLQVHAGEGQVVHGVQEGLFVLQELIEGGEQHIAGRAHIAFQIQCFHLRIPPNLPFD